MALWLIQSAIGNSSRIFGSRKALSSTTLEPGNRSKITGLRFTVVISRSVSRMSWQHSRPLIRTILVAIRMIPTLLLIPTDSVQGLHSCHHEGNTAPDGVYTSIRRRRCRQRKLDCGKARAWSPEAWGASLLGCVRVQIEKRRNGSGNTTERELGRCT